MLNSNYYQFFLMFFLICLLKGFEELQKAYIKATPVIIKEENGQTPRFFIRCLVEMEDFINEMWVDKDGRKNMSKNNRSVVISVAYNCIPV